MESKKKIIQLHEKDNVAVVLMTLHPGDKINFNNREITVISLIEIGHKMAILNISNKKQIIKYGIVIGKATENIKAGVHVHTHNMKSNYISIGHTN